MPIRPVINNNIAQIYKLAKSTLGSLRNFTDLKNEFNAKNSVFANELTDFELKPDYKFMTLHIKYCHVSEFPSRIITVLDWTIGFIGASLQLQSIITAHIELLLNNVCLYEESPTNPGLISTTTEFTNELLI
jgi:hypothetical protein